MPGDSRSLWSAVKIAKDTGTSEIPRNMTYIGMPIASDKVAESFAQYFQETVSKIVENSQIDPNVYNGCTKMGTVDCDFMTAIDIYFCGCGWC